MLGPAMRILMISTDFVPLPGGLARHVIELSKALCALGHDVMVLSVPMQGAPAGWSVVEGVPVFRARWLPPGLKRFKLAVPVAVTTLAGYALRRPVDIVHWHNVPRETLAAKRAYGPRRVFTNHTSGFVRAATAGNEQQLRPYRAAIDLADAVIACCPRRADLSRQYAHRPGKVVYIPNGVDTERFSPARHRGEDIRPRYRLGPHAPLVLTVARLELVKGVDNLVAAMLSVAEREPQARLLLVGNGAERSRLQERVAAMGLQRCVVFAGEQPNEIVPQYLRACDIAVLPSRIEATSIFGLEAMACGKPLVGTRVGGIPEVVDDGRTGVLVEPGNPEQMASAICDLLANPAKRHAMGTAARERAVAEFSWRAIAERTAALYESLLQEPRRAA